jgi:hypothetical protein
MHAAEITRFYLEDRKQLEVIMHHVDWLMSSLSNLPCNLNSLLKLTPQHFADLSPTLSSGSQHSLARFCWSHFKLNDEIKSHRES